jgi:tRNA-dihydrouridine synthase A
MSLVAPAYLSIAPMVDWTNTHFRVFMRMLLPQAWLYTEMEPLGAILNHPEKTLRYHPMEHPLVLQVGGSDMSGLIQALHHAEAAGFDEFNLNLGCPSPKVQSGQFGACLMNEGGRVAQWVRALKQEAKIPITIKMRTGLDHQDDYSFFSSLAQQWIEAGIDKLVVHARKAWLTGLNPKQNRTIPPLHYDYVYRLKQTYPKFPIIINGHLNDLKIIQEVMKYVDGVMIGRLACDNPYALTTIHHYFYPESPKVTRNLVLKNYLTYAYEQACLHERLTVLLKPVMNLAHGLPNAKKYKQILLETMQSKNTESLLGLLESCDSLLHSSMS